MLSLIRSFHVVKVLLIIEALNSLISQICVPHRSEWIYRAATRTGHSELLIIITSLSGLSMVVWIRLITFVFEQWKFSYFPVAFSNRRQNCEGKKWARSTIDKSCRKNSATKNNQKNRYSHDVLQCLLLRSTVKWITVKSVIECFFTATSEFIARLLCSKFSLASK